MSLNAAENRRLLEELAKYPKGSKQYDLIFSQLVNGNMGLVVSCANKYFSGKKLDEIEDIISVGKLGLMKAVLGFDLSKDVEFSTTARSFIRNEICVYFRYENKHRKIDQLSKPVANGGGNEDKIIEEILSSEEDFEERLLSQDEKNRVLDTVAKAMEKINPKYRQLLKLRYFSGDKSLTQTEVGELLGISHQGIAVNEFRAIKKIKSILGIKEEEKENLDLKRTAEIKAELKNIIETKLSPLQAEILLSTFYSLSRENVSRENETVYRQVAGAKHRGIRTLQKVYNKSSKTKLSIDEIKKILKFNTNESE